MKFHVLTLFPEIIHSYTNESILGIAQKNGLISVETHQIRDYATDKHKHVDDKPFGGGSGMILKADVLIPAIRDIRKKHAIERVIYLSPKGKTFNHKDAKRLSSYSSILMISGRYEGMDQRVIDACVDEELSIGDYVLSGGELPAMVVIDSTARQIPGVLGDSDGLKEESFSGNLLEYPQYTRPQEYEEMKVPDVLLSGNHAEIRQWKEVESLKITQKNRSDILLNNKELLLTINQRLYLALIHYPVVNKRGLVVTTSLTNFDIHDLARTCTTFGVQKYFMVTPIEVQQKMAHFIKDYWRSGKGAEINPDRRDAFQNMEIANDLAQTCLTIEKLHGKYPRLVATSAKRTSQSLSYDDFKLKVITDDRPVLLLFGTGWGLAPEIFEKVDDVLEPIDGAGEYNHLPVRSAVAIILDRLFR